MRRIVVRSGAPGIARSRGHPAGAARRLDHVPLLHVTGSRRIIAELLVRNPGVGDLLADLEADDDLRARFELEPLGR